MIELAHAAPVFRQSGRVDRVAILENRAGRTAAVRHIVLRSATVYLLGPQIVAVVGESVAGSSWVSNADDTVRDVIGERRDSGSHGDRFDSKDG